MSKLPLKMCSHPGCNKLTREPRCKEHKKELSKNRPGDPFYSSRDWIRVRNKRRELSPCCEECEKSGVLSATYAVDHIQARREFPELELDIENTQGLCERCHNRKTAGEVAARRNA